VFGFVRDCLRIVRGLEVFIHDDAIDSDAIDATQGHVDTRLVCEEEGRP
jgi:hypothetical protein